jgi:hypothetical protein
MDELCQPQPNPAPKSPDGEILQLEPVNAPEPELELSIPDDNPLKKLCGEIFEMGFHACAVDRDDRRFVATGNYELLKEIEFGDAEVGSILSSRLDENDDAADTYKNVCGIFGVNSCEHNRTFPFIIKKGISGQRWNAFIAKLIQFVEYEKASKELRKYSVCRNSYIAGQFRASMKFSDSQSAFAHMLAGKVSGAFLEALDGAASKPPLSDFYAVRESSVRLKIISAFIFYRIYAYVGQLADGLQQSTAVSFKGRLELTKHRKISEYTIDTLIRNLVLKTRDSRACTPKETVGVISAFNQLLGRLDATVCKALAETSFEFVLESDEAGNPARMEEMTMAQYFDTLEEQWSEKTSAEDGETNGAHLRRAELNRENAEKLLAEFLSPLADGSVAAV